jgi:hypothetical protein
MGEPKAPPNRDRELPKRTGDEMGGSEPLIPPTPQPHERRPLPEEGADERERQNPRRANAQAPCSEAAQHLNREADEHRGIRTAHHVNRTIA